jgi:hypothetical protein
MYIECITARAQPTPNAKPRKNPIMAPHSKVTVCRMARHAGLFHPRGAIVAVSCGELTVSGLLDDCFSRGVYSTLPAPESIVVELSFEAARWCDHSTSASPDSNGTGVLCHVRVIGNPVVERNWRDFSTRVTRPADDVPPMGTLHPQPLLHTERLHVRKRIA